MHYNKRISKRGLPHNLQDSKVQKYTTKTGKEQFKPSFAQLERAAHKDEGYCLACGAKAFGVEPDARKYVCECCEEPKVYGAEELVLMGLFH